MKWNQKLPYLSINPNMNQHPMTTFTAIFMNPESLVMLPEQLE